jgi:hypothetical protein
MTVVRLRANLPYPEFLDDVAQWTEEAEQQRDTSSPVGMALTDPNLYLIVCILRALALKAKLSPSCQKLYLYIWGKACTKEGMKTELEIDLDQFQAWLAHWSSPPGGKGVSHKTINRTLKKLRQRHLIEILER